jgi:pimeloyl-ACP methyl ester carboxylesterase
MGFFEGFELGHVGVGDVVLLAERHTVVCPDLRGYGESTKVPTTPDHAPYSKRVMAADMLGLMRSLGHNRFAVVGHDRGAYVAQRLAVDHPDSVAALVVMDAVPIGEALAQADARACLTRTQNQSLRRSPRHRSRRLSPRFRSIGHS